VETETAKSQKSQRQSFTCFAYEVIGKKEKINKEKKPKLEILLEELIKKNQNSKKNNQKIVKEIKQECSTCQNIYQLLEIHKIDIATENEDERCACLNEWKKILAEYFQKELADYLNNIENEASYYD
jgi:flagellar biosynthesis GTPase FlhF